ncbi:MAG: hypothetical protein ABIW94_04895, partial [Gemmatimonadaceae bacterium]
MLSDSGSGFSRWRDLSVTRWREDVTRDNWGTYLLLRDEERGAVWSATRQYKKRTRQHGITRYEITVENPGHVCQGVALLELEGKAFAGIAAIALTDDGRTHSV